MKTFLFFIALFIIAAVLFITLPPLGLSTNDEGIKYLQMKSLYLNKWGSLGIDYPGLKIDPKFEFLGRQTFLFVKSDKLYCTYSPVFTFISSLFYPVFKDRAIHLLGLISLLLSALILRGCLRAIRINESFLVFILFTFVFASPVFQYSLIFLEHIPSLVFVTASLYFIVIFFKKDMPWQAAFAGCFFMGLGIFFRPEIVVFLMGISLTLAAAGLVNKKISVVTAVLTGSALPLVLYGCMNYFIFHNHPLGLHLYLHLPFIEKWHRPSPIYMVGSFLLFTGLAFSFWFTRNEDKQVLRKAYSIIPILWMVFLLVVLRMSIVNTLFFVFPIMVLILADFSQIVEDILAVRLKLEHVLLGSVVIYITIISIIFTGHAQHDVRYFMPIVPFVLVYIVIFVDTIKNSRVFHYVFILLILYCFAVNAYVLKIKTLRYIGYNQKRVEFLAEKTMARDIVVFTESSLMEHCAPLFLERIFFVAEEPRKLLNIISRLKEKRITACYLWVSPYSKDKYLGIIKRKGYNVIGEEELKVDGGSPTYFLVKIKI